MTRIYVSSWDVQTVTVTDYSVSWDIPPDMFEKFESEHSDNPVYEFKRAMIKDFEAILSDQPHVNKPEEMIVINDIVFAFSNAKMINLLAERGTELGYGRSAGDGSKVDKIE